MKRLTLLCASLLATPVCFAADVIGAAPSAQGRQVVLYVQKSLGVQNATPTWGLRLDEMSALPGMTEAASATVHRRELVNFAMTPLERARVDFGKRMRWDLHAGSFGSPNRD
jgi:hypothetical protein